LRGAAAATTTAGCFPIGVGGISVLPMNSFADEKKANAENGDDGQ